MVRLAGEGVEVEAIATTRVRPIEEEDEEAEVETAFLMESILKMSVATPLSSQVSEVEVAVEEAIKLVMSVRCIHRPKPLMASSDKAEPSSSSKRRGRDKPMTMTPEVCRREITKRLQTQRI